MAGLDPDGRAMIKDLIRHVSGEGSTIFFSSHLLHDVEDLCNYLVILKNGEMAYQGNVSDFILDINLEYEIEFKLNGKTNSVLLSSKEEVNKKLKELLEKGALILTVNPKKKTLEEAFVTLSFGGNNKN